MSSAIADHALIGDSQTAALVNSRLDRLKGNFRKALTHLAIVEDALGLSRLVHSRDALTKVMLVSECQQQQIWCRKGATAATRSDDLLRLL